MALLQGIVGQDPDRLTFIDVATGDSLTVQYNPTEVTENLASQYNRAGILGLSHQPLQYAQTENMKVGFELAFDSLAQPGRYDIMAARRFLMRFHYARRGGTDIRAGAPGRVIVVWPNLYTLTCKLMTTVNKFSRFQQDGTPTFFTAGVAFEEVRDKYLYADDVAIVGTIRPPGGQGSG